MGACRHWVGRRAKPPVASHLKKRRKGKKREKEEGREGKGGKGGGALATTVGGGVAGGHEVGDRALGRLGRRASPPELPREATRESGAEGSRRFKTAEI